MTLGCREAFSRCVKPLPAISQPTAPFPEEGVLMVTNLLNTPKFIIPDLIVADFQLGVLIIELSSISD